MHYKNGREAKAGDKVFHIPQGLAGILHSLQPGSSSCNGRLAQTTQSDPYVTVGECLHQEDIAAGTGPSFSDSDLAKRMYDMYCKAVGGFAFNGDPLPTWEVFSTDPAKVKQANGWLCVAGDVNSLKAGAP